MSRKLKKLLLCVWVLLFGIGHCGQVCAQAASLTQEKGVAVDHRQVAARETAVAVKPNGLEKAQQKVGYGIERVARGISQAIDKKLAGVAGDWIDHVVVWGITWFTLIVLGFLLLLLLLTERLLRFGHRFLLRRAPSSEQTLGWLELLLRAFSKPLSLFVWIYGTYGILSPLFIHFQRLDGTNPVHDAARRIANFGGSIAFIWFLYRMIGLFDARLEKWAAASGNVVDRILAALVRRWRRPLRFLAILILIRMTFPLLIGPPGLFVILRYGFLMVFIAGLAWLLIATTSVMEELVLSRFRMDDKDNLAARKVHTQIRFLHRLSIIAVIVLAVAAMLMIFPQVRQIGTSILASAGVVGIIAGLAAQRTLGNIFVGIQIAISQPIRVEDVVVVENEWGWIEEITATYVVVRIWDLRRLILPISYFAEKPFQNWTRTSADLLGTVFLYVDYTVPIERVRNELYRILQNSPYWDGKAWVLQVTDATEKTMQLRALMSAVDSPTAWNLRCEVREKLITFIQQNFPESLPKFRAELEWSEPHCTPASRDETGV